MAIYSLSLATVNQNTGQPGVEWQTTDSSARILEIGCALTAASAPLIAISRPALPGVMSPGSTARFQPDNPADGLCTVFGAVGWTRNPTPGTSPIYFRRFAFVSGSQGQAFRWRFAEGLVLPPNSSLVLWLVVGGAPTYVDCVIDF